MSFAEKITGLLQRPNQAEQAPDTPWFMIYGGRILGIVGAFFAILFGLYNTISILLLNVMCLVSGILQMLLGFVVMSLEAPCCFFFIDFVNNFSERAEREAMWKRAAAYCSLSLIPIILCPGLGSFFGCGLIFGTGVIYGMMSLGKKASREDMAAAATSPTQIPPGGGQMQMSTDQNITLMEDPDVWRPT